VYGLPLVAVSGTGERPGLTRIVLNHDTAAEFGLRHLAGLGHRNIAFIRGQEFTSDAEVRWASIRAAAQRMGVAVDPVLVVQLDTDTPSPETGYVAAKQLLNSGRRFTAVFAFNDISAFGAIRAFREAGKRVPEDVSVVGFDDINSAAYHIPALTTIRQPLQRMGALAAEVLVKRIANPGGEIPKRVMVEPELVIRESTCVVRDE